MDNICHCERSEAASFQHGYVRLLRQANAASQRHRSYMDDLYREIIIEHYKNPGYRGHLDPHDIQFADNNPLCGDHIEITLRTDDQGNVADARFDGHGCAISQASADLLMESIVGRPIEDVKKLNKQDVLDMLGIDLGPVRLKCALLSLKVLKAGVYGLGEASESLVE